MPRVLLACLLLIAISSAAEGGEVLKVQTTSGDTYFSLRTSMSLKCSGGVTRNLRKITRVVGESEQEGSWDDLPDFFMQWDDERSGYVLLSNEDEPEEREVLGYVDVDPEYRKRGCRTYIKVEALGGITKLVDVQRVRWPILVNDRSAKTVERPSR